MVRSGSSEPGDGGSIVSGSVLQQRCRRRASRRLVRRDRDEPGSDPASRRGPSPAASTRAPRRIPRHPAPSRGRRGWPRRQRGPWRGVARKRAPRTRPRSLPRARPSRSSAHRSPCNPPCTIDRRNSSKCRRRDIRGPPPARVTRWPAPAARAWPSSRRVRPDATTAAARSCPIQRKCHGSAA